MLFSHEADCSDFEIEFATDDVAKMLEFLNNAGYDSEFEDSFYRETQEEMTVESIRKFSSYPCGVDFDYDDLSYRYVLKSMEVQLPESREIWGVFANGGEVFSWRGELEGLFGSKDEALDFIIRETTDNDDEAEDALDELIDFGVYNDANWTYWVLQSFFV